MERIKEVIERQHEEIRRLTTSGPTNENFRTRLLQELKQAEVGFHRERNTRAQRFSEAGNPDSQNFAPTTPPKGQQ